MTEFKHIIQPRNLMSDIKVYIKYRIYKKGKKFSKHYLNPTQQIMRKNGQNIPKIRVVIRKRPLSKKQLGRAQTDIVQIRDHKSVIVKQQKVKVDLTPYTDQYKFIFDGAFNQNVTNQQIYFSTISPLIDAAFDGAKVSCFAYGQTGSGKTYTMLGDGKQIKGLYILAAKNVFDLINQYQDMSVWVSFYEIYCGKLYDLLNQRNILHVRQDGKNNIQIVGLSERKTSSVTQVMNTISFGSSIRITSQNSTNVDSSRSHAVLQIHLKKNKKVHGKILFIDLAGSQRAADHADQTDKQTRIDGAQINKSLLALKQCIRALDQDKNHIPFRGSKLTMVLKDSFSGYCATVMIGNVSPNSSSCQDTLNTLKYADRVKQLKKMTNTQLMPGDYLNYLSKQLMLPRQLVNHNHYQHKNQQQIQHARHSQLEHNLIKNNYFQQNRSHINNNNQKVNIFRNSQTKNKGQVKMLQNNSSSLLFKQNNANRNLPQQQQQVRQLSGNKNRSISSSTPNNNTNNNKLFNKLSPYHQQKIQQQSSQQVYQRLNERHQQLLQKVIEDQQGLLSQHENYINQSVESAKQHIHIMNQANQSGNSIHEYLNKLEGNLDLQLEHIYRIKARIENLRYTLDQSKKVEKLYLSINHQTQNTNQSSNQYSNIYQNDSRNINYYSPNQSNQNYSQPNCQNPINLNFEDDELLFQS